MSRVRSRPRPVFAFLFLVALLAVAAPLAAKRGGGGKAKAVPTTWAEVAAKLPKKESARIAAAARFAKDYRPALKQRLSATRAWRKEADAKLKDRLAAELHEAMLRGLQRDAGKRARAFARAEKTATELKVKKVELIKSARDADTALATIEWALKNTKGKPGPKVRDAIAALETNISAYQKLGDTPRAMSARLALVEIALRDEADLYAAAPAYAARLEKLRGKDRGLKDRDLFPVRARIERRLALLAETEGRTSDAVLHHLRSDALLATGLDVALFEAPEPALYTKTPRTMEFCRRAKKEGKSCVDLARKKKLPRSYFDFTRHSAEGAFDPGLAGEVLEEYQPLLDDCLAAGAKTRDLKNSRIEVEWAIGHDGRVKEYDLFPTRLRGGPFDQCLRESFDAFRYPRYRGEQQHMRLNWSIGE